MGIVADRITDKQYDFIMDLYMEIGQEAEDDIENLSISEASNLISELLEIKRDLEG